MINQGMQKRPQEHQKLQRENKNITNGEKKVQRRQPTGLEIEISICTTSVQKKR